MRQYFIFFILLTNNLCSIGQNVLIKSFNSQNSGYDYAWRSEPTLDGGVIISGYSSKDGTDQTIQGYLIKLDSSFNVEWSKNYDTCSFGSVVTADDSGFLAVGVTAFNLLNSSGTFVIKTNSLGQILWSKVFEGTGALAILKTSDNGYILAGTATRNWGSSGGSVICLTKIDSVGNLQWNNSYGYNASIGEMAWCVKETSDQNFIVTGGIYSNNFSDSGAVYLLKTNSTGNFLWAKTYHCSYSLRGFDVICTADSGYLVTGDGQVNLNRFASLLKTDKNGNIQWTRVYTRPVTLYGFRVIHTSDNGYLISTLGDLYKMALLKTDSIGHLTWVKEFDYYPIVSGGAQPSGLWETNNHEFVFTATSNTNNGDIFIARTTSAPDSCSSWINDISDSSFYPTVDSIIFDEVNLFQNSTIVRIDSDLILSDSVICQNGISLVFDYSDSDQDFINVYPNPFTNELNIIWNGGQSEKVIILIDVRGKEIFQQKLTGIEAKLNTEKLSAGIYFLNCNTVNYKLVKF